MVLMKCITWVRMFLYLYIHVYTHVLYSKVQTLDFTGTWSIEK